MIIEALAIPFAVSAKLGLLLSAIMYIPLIIMRMEMEEAALLRFMGKDYADYMLSTPKLIPKIRSLLI
jgi:protein-S-isoprenylcysteine O-methyltransferase Ste14